MLETIETLKRLLEENDRSETVSLSTLVAQDILADLEQAENNAVEIVQVKATLEDWRATPIAGDFTRLVEEVIGAIETWEAPVPEQVEGKISRLIALYVTAQIGIAREQAQRDAGQHVYQHDARDAEPLINTEVERNSRGFNFKCVIVGARDPDEALRLTDEVLGSLQRVYGQQNAELAASKPVKTGKSRPEALEPEEL
jgi:hypothetical protein